MKNNKNKPKIYSLAYAPFGADGDQTGATVVIAWDRTTGVYARGVSLYSPAEWDQGVPFDPEKPFITSGVRIGTPAVTTRGMKEPQMRVIASLIDRTLRNIGSPDALAQVSRQVDELVADFPLYSELIAAIE